MTYDPEKHHRRSIRLPEYDYSQPGAYFVTICTQNRPCLFGEVVTAEMVLNDAGRMAWKWWNELNRKFPNLETDVAVVMPNHIHGILMIHEFVGATLRGRPTLRERPVVDGTNGPLAPPEGHPHRAPTVRGCGGMV